MSYTGYKYVGLTINTVVGLFLGTSAYYLSRILQNADRPRYLHAEAERSHPGQLPDPVAQAVETLAAQRSEWTGAYRQFQAVDRAVIDRYVAQARRTAERDRSRGQGADGLEL